MNEYRLGRGCLWKRWIRLSSGPCSDKTGRELLAGSPRRGMAGKPNYRSFEPAFKNERAFY